MAETYTNDIITMTVEPLGPEEAICILRMLRPGPVTVEMVRSNNALYLEHGRAKNRVIIDGFNVRFMNRAARLEANDPRMKAVTLCMALLVKTPASAAVANFFLHVVKPPYPLRLFDDEAKARSWLVSQPQPGTVIDDAVVDR